MRTLTLIAACGALAACAVTGTTATSTTTGTGTTGGTGGTVAAPTPLPTPGVYNNDFKIALSSATPGATICFTLDGSTPSCAAGSCQGTAATYNSQGQVPIDGSATNTVPGPSYGTVTLNSLACKAGMADGTTAAATYTLQVAVPALSDPPSGSTVLYDAGAASAAVTSDTLQATAFYTTSQSDPPTCTNGTPLYNLPAQLPIGASAGSGAFLIIGCKTGYVPSTVLDGTYSFALNAPTFSPASSVTYDANTPIEIDDSANAGSGDTVCATTDGSQPACGCDVSQQRSGGVASPYVVNRTGTILRAIACPGPGSPFAASAPGSSGAYTLQLDPIAFNPLSMTPIPYSAPLEVDVSQGGSGEPYDFICVSTDGSAPDCTCDTTAHPTWQYTAGQESVSQVREQATVEAVGCLSPGNPDLYLPSNTPAASATYSPATPMATPAIEPANGIIQSNPQQVTFTNDDTAATAYFCYTLDDTPPVQAAAGTASCTTAVTAPGATSSDGPSVSVSGTTVRVIACDVANVKPPSAEPTPLIFH